MVCSPFSRRVLRDPISILDTRHLDVSLRLGLGIPTGETRDGFKVWVPVVITLNPTKRYVVNCWLRH